VLWKTPWAGSQTLHQGVLCPWASQPLPGPPFPPQFDKEAESLVPTGSFSLDVVGFCVLWA